MADHKLQSLLRKVGLEHLLPTFLEQKVSFEMLNSISDKDMSRLGIETLGDRVRLREEYRVITDNNVLPNNNPPTVSRGAALMHERSLLFGPRGPNSRRGGKKRRQTNFVLAKQPWTVNTVCMADRFSRKVPTGQEKIILAKAGLGFKKIKLDLEDDEATVRNKLMCCEIENEGGSPLGFPQLQNAGGFELMRCVANCRDLEVMQCSLAAKAIKNMLGGSQGKIYLRPIQHSLSTLPLVQENNTSTLKELCKVCGAQILVSELRKHLRECAEENSDDELLEYSPFTFMDNMSQRSLVDSSTSSTSSLITEPATTAVNPRSSSSDTDSTTTTNHTLTVDTISTSSSPSTNSIPSAIPSTMSSSVSNSAHGVITHETDTTPADIKKIIKECIEKNYHQNPVLVLKYMQKSLIKGRPLEIIDPTVCINGQTNLIMVDRSKLVRTGLEELTSLEDKFITLEVQFYGEVAEDFGGPRKEFFLLLMRHVEKEYFQQSIREDLEQDYYAIGLLFGISMLQNGKVPRFLGEEKLEEIFKSEFPSPCMREVRRGLIELGIFQIANAFPTFLNLLRPNEHDILTYKRTITLLKGNFAEVGTNERMYQNHVYEKFIKYLKEAAGGRRGAITLGSILKFITGSDEEPPLGFELQPSLKFIEAENSDTFSFTPRANTCINQLLLPRPVSTASLPDVGKLFPCYDLAFSNEYFGFK